MVAPEATVLKVLETFCKTVGKISVLESLFKRNFTTGVLLGILRNFEEHIFTELF